MYFIKIYGKGWNGKMIEFDETGLYKGFVKNAKGQKYQSGRN